MTKELENIKKKALENKQDIDDNSADIIKYKEQIKLIQSELTADEPKLELLKSEFNKKRIEAMDNQELVIKDRYKIVKRHYINYAVSCARLNRVGRGIVFFDKDQAKYVEVVAIEKFDISINAMREDRLIDYRENMSIRKMIQDEAIDIINNRLMPGEVTEILDYIRSYKKIFEPVKKQISKYYFNTYTPNGFLEVKVKNIIDLDGFVNNIMPLKYPAINALMKNLAPIYDERKYMINWMSYILNTARKTMNAIALVGIQGTGKGVLQTQLIEHAIHRDNCYVVGNQDISSSFNGYIENKLFLFFNEIKGNWNESSTQADKVKGIITDPTVSLNDKFRKQVYIDNFANCMLFSNHEDFLQIENNDRRYSVIKTEHKTLKEVANQDFKIEISDFIKLIKDERDNFLIEMKMLEHNKKSETLALSLVENEVKQKIKERTNTVREKVKSKILDKDIDWFENTIDDLIHGSEHEKLIVGERQRVIQHHETQDDIVIKEPEILHHTNLEFKQFMLQEIKQGVFLNETLRWFSKIYDIEHTGNPRGFGTFWGTVINKSEVVKVKTENETTTKKIRIVNKNEISEVIFNGETFVLADGTKNTFEKVIPF